MNKIITCQLCGYKEDIKRNNFEKMSWECDNCNTKYDITMDTMKISSLNKIKSSSIYKNIRYLIPL
ncbi:MAG: hypothetical protein WC679_01805 [Bacteroidales bacterium]|jgi:ribosomal protein L37AE/L43A